MSNKNLFKKTFKKKNKKQLYFGLLKNLPKTDKNLLKTIKYQI